MSDRTVLHAQTPDGTRARRGARLSWSPFALAGGITGAVSGVARPRDL